VFEELRSVLVGDDVHNVAIPPILGASLPLTETLAYPVYRLFISVVCLALFGILVWLGRRRCSGLGLLGFRLFQRQLELGDDPFEPLRARPELLTAEFGDLRFQLLDGQLGDDEPIFGGSQFGLCRFQLGGLGHDEPLQCIEVIGQLVGRERHTHPCNCFASSGLESHGRSAQIVIPPASAARSAGEPATPALPRASTVAPASA